MKQPKKLEIKKVTLRNLDDLQLDAVAGGCCPTLEATCFSICGQKTCHCG